MRKIIRPKGKINHGRNAKENKENSEALKPELLQKELQLQSHG